MNNMKCGSSDRKRILTEVQFLCFFAAVILECLVMFIGKMHGRMIYPPFHMGMLICGVTFTVTVIIQSVKTGVRYPFALSAAMVIWFTVVEMRHRAAGMTEQPYGMFLVPYLLALPFARVTRDEKKQIGITAASYLYIGATLVLVLYALMLVSGCVPSILSRRLSWSSYRLTVVHHPNISARAFMISFGLCLGLMFRTSRRWLKGTLLAAAALIFATLSLTSSRTSILMACLLGGGVIFFALYRRGTIREFLTAAAVAAAVTVCLYLVSQGLFEWNEARLKAAEILRSASAETAIVHAKEISVPKLGSSGIMVSQNTFGNDLPTLNGRTMIWRAAIESILKEPSILLWGCDNTKELVAIYGANHTHNSWLETLSRLGLPGLMISVLFTWQAVQAAVVLLLRKDAGVWKKTVAMLVLCLLASGVVEPNLFFTEEIWHYADFMFFLCLGYLVLWNKEKMVEV